MDVTISAPFRAYKGSKPFIFVSYAHLNSAEVFKHISILNSITYRIWYDEGIDPGSEWPEEIARAIDGCACFMVFLSPEAVASENVRKEINFALSRRKFILCVHIRETFLPPGLEMQLGNIQAIFEYRMKSKDRYYEKLTEIIPKTARDSNVTLPSAIQFGQDGRQQNKKSLLSSVLSIFKGQPVPVPASLQKNAIEHEENAGITVRTSDKSTGQLTGVSGATGTTGTTVATAEAVYVPVSEPKKVPVSTDAGNIITFKPSGTASVKLTNKQVYTCPANCILFRSYHRAAAGLPEKPDESYSGCIATGPVPFEEITSFSVMTATNANGYEKDYNLSINTIDGVIMSRTYKKGALVFITGKSKLETDIADVESVEFSHNSRYPEPVRLALVRPSNGSPFHTPADLIKVNVKSVGMGVGTSWYDGLPLESGTVIPFRKIKGFEIKESSANGVAGWGAQAKLLIELNDGDLIEENINKDSCDFVGLNRFGVFKLGVGNELKSIQFPV